MVRQSLLKYPVSPSPWCSGLGQERMIPEVSYLDLKKEWRTYISAGGEDIESGQDRTMKLVDSYITGYRY